MQNFFHGKRISKRRFEPRLMKKHLIVELSMFLCTTIECAATKAAVEVVVTESVHTFGVYTLFLCSSVC